MKTLILLINLILILFIGYGQQSNYEEVVYLKSGSIIRGIIVEQVPNKQIKIQTKDRNVFVFSMDEIEKITKELISIKTTGNTNETITDEKKSEYQKSDGSAVIIELGTAIYRYTSNGSQAAFSLRTLFGGRVSEYTSMGLQFGIDLAGRKNLGSPYKLSDAIFIPVGLGMRFGFLKSRGTPFFDLGMGYVLNLQRVFSYAYYYNYPFYSNSFDILHGFHIAPTLGGKVWATKKVAVTFKLGYQLFAFPSNGSVDVVHSMPILFGMEY